MYFIKKESEGQPKKRLGQPRVKNRKKIFDNIFRGNFMRKIDSRSVKTIV